MSSEVGGEGEVLIALIALIFAFVMDGHHVSLQIGGKTERLAAQIALVNGAHFLGRLQRHITGSQRGTLQRRTRVRLNRLRLLGLLLLLLWLLLLLMLGR